MAVKRLLWTILALLIFLLPGALVALPAQDPPAVPPQVQPPQTTTAPVLRVDSVITRTVQDGQRGDQPTAASELRLGNNVRLRVVNLSDWIKAGNSPWNLILFLNERPMKGIHPISVDQKSGYLNFHLERRGDNVPIWEGMMERDKNWDWGKVSRRLRASVGIDGGVAAESTATFEMVFLTRFWFLFVLASTGLSFWLLVFLGRKKSLLRASPQAPYSLARAQMALWSWLTLNAYLYLYALSHDPAVEIPVSMLGLLGISATTYLAAAMVDRTSTNTAPEASLGFFRDIAGGATVSLHRLQMIGWTLVLAIAFIAQVVNKLSIPDFNPTLLGLMGLSAGTYVGFKFPENAAGQSNTSTKTTAALAGK